MSVEVDVELLERRRMVARQSLDLLHEGEPDRG